MIHCVTPEWLPLLQQLLARNDWYACRIGCLLDSYGLGYPFAAFFVQVTEDGHPVGAAARYYHDMTLLLTDDSDTNEWQSMITMWGCRSLLCDRVLQPERPSDTLTVMTLTQLLPPPDVPQGLVMTDTPDLKALWALLKRCEAADFAVPSYEDFLLDLSHKLRHGTAVCRVLQQAQQPVAAAMTVAQTAHAAILGGVAVDPSFRRQGLGTWCVRSLCQTLSGRTVYLMRDPQRHALFYRRCGFADTAACTLTY